MRFFEISTNGLSTEWINLDLVTRVGLHVSDGTGSPELELRLAGGGAPAPVTDASKIEELMRILGITLPDALTAG
jgi:hypothetical protein